MTAAPPPAAADRFALIIDGLCRAIAASRTGGLMAPVLLLLWNRLRRSVTRFAALAAQVHAGTLPRSRTRPRSTRHTCEACPGPRAGSRYPRMPASPVGKSPPPPLPRAFGWLIRLIPGVAGFRSQLKHLLSDPEIAELLSAAPQMGRILRPLCHMLAIGPSPDLPPSLLSPSPQSMPLPPSRGLPPSIDLPLPPSRERQPTNTQAPAITPPVDTQPPRPPPDPLQSLLFPPPPAPA